MKMKNLNNLFIVSAIIGCCFSFSFSSAYAQNACSNAALNRPASANASTPTEVPSKAFDGDLATNWCAPGFNGWIKVDLQNKLTINSIKLHVNQAISGNTVHEIKVSDDMVNWAIVETLSGYTSNNQILTVYFNPALSDVRGVMINTTSSNSWVAWNEIEVYESPSKPTITQNGDVLISSSTSNNQWYFNGSPIPDATSQFYTGTVSGSYQVGVSNENGCLSMSEAASFTAITTGINKIGEIDVTFFPNPAKDNFVIEGVSKGKIELLNLQGKVINSVNVSDSKTSMDLSNLTGGVYSIKITTNDGIIVRKLLKQ
jgi:hypothetical protein